MPTWRSVKQPLLPYEKRLIHVLGCTESEYREFVQQVQYFEAERAKAYAVVPDIRNGAVAIAVVAIVVSVISTAASVLLAPKPRMPSAPKQARKNITQRQLGGGQGSSAFAPSFGFDTVQNLAEYGQIVPIVFTKRTGEADEGTGGLLISPLLVWSRMKSWGNYQIAEILTIAGQGEMNRPELPGIFLGNNALDGLYEEYFDVYWVAGAFDSSRPLGKHLRYGELNIDGNSEAEGVGKDDPVFYAPTREGVGQSAFCGAFSPTSQTRFGVHSAIPNGTPYRANWRIISIPEDFDNTQRKQAKNQQKKYVDQYLMDTHQYGGGSKDESANADEAGMPGTGTNFARRIGIVEHHSKATNTTTKISGNATNFVRETSGNNHPSWHNLRLEVQCAKGDTIKVLIGKGIQTEKPFKTNSGDDVDLMDVRTSVQSDSVRYDAMLSNGSTWMIGRTTWVVTNRSTQEPYDAMKESNTNDGITVTLRCLETWSGANAKIGIVAEEAITVADYLPYTQEGDDIHEAYYPLTKYEIGMVQNTRNCDVTEIGIKSQVWAKFEGITHFNTIPAAGILVKENKNNVQLKEGKLTSFAPRLSLFLVDVRPSNYDTSKSDNNGWVNLGPYKFGVVGNSPIDQYSFLRIVHPNRAQYEFRFRPLPSSVPVNQGAGDYDIIILDGGHPGQESWESETIYDSFQLSARGYKSQPRDYYTHKEMAAIPEKIVDEDGAIAIRYNVVDAKSSPLKVELVSVKALTAGSHFAIGDPISDNTASNIYAIAADLDPYFDNLGAGAKTVVDWAYERDENNKVYMKLHLVSYERSYAHTDRNYWWRVEKIELDKDKPFVGNYTAGNTFEKRAKNKNGVQFGFTYRFTQPTATKQSTRTITATRLWQKFSGVAEVSHYGDIISRSCDTSCEHEIIYVNETIAEDTPPKYNKCAMAGLKWRSNENFTRVDQLRTYVKNGVHVELLNEPLVNNKVQIGPSNLLTDLFFYLVTNKNTGAGNILNSALVDTELLKVTGKYLKANKLYWDSVISEPINLRTWLAEQAPSVLCFVSIKNGRTALEPALPFKDNGEIDTGKKVEIKAMFNEANILEDTLEFNWLELEERKMFQAVIIFNKSRVNQFPEQKTLVAYYGKDNSSLPVEEFALDHITSDEHAAKVARYFLALRKYQTHTITFKTLPWGLSLAAGDFIRVASEMSPYRPENNGVVQADGTIISTQDISAGAHNVYVWSREKTDKPQPAVREAILRVAANGKATTLRNSVFSLKGDAEVNNAQVYQIEALDIDDEGIVTMKASNYVVDDRGVSQVAIDVLDTAGAITIENESIDEDE